MELCKHAILCTEVDASLWRCQKNVQPASVYTIYIYTNVWHFVINVYSNFTLTQALSNWLNIHYSSVVSLDVNLLHVFTILSLQVFH